MNMAQKHAALWTLQIGFIAALIGWGRSAEAVDFLRGDANGDGVVSIADVHRMLGFLYHSFAPPDCMRSADLDDSGMVDGADPYYLWTYLFWNGFPPPWPFPSPGREVTHTGEIECVTYGGGAPLADPAATLQVIDVTVSGGTVARVKMTLAVSSSSAIAGFSGKLAVPVNLVASVETTPIDLTGTTLNNQGADPYTVAYLKSNSIRFGLISSATASPEDTRWIPPGHEVAAMQISMCLKGGIPAGTYPLTLTAGELIEATSARAIQPVLVSGALTLQKGVSSLNDCDGILPPRPQEDIHAMYRIDDGSAEPGSPVSVPLIIRADRAVQGYSFSVDFDEEVLQATQIEEVWKRPDGLDFFYKVFDMNNDNSFPGSHGVDEGYLIGAVVIDITSPLAMPASTDNVALRFDFMVKPDISPTVTEVSFMDGGRFTNSPPTRNNLTVDGKTFIPEPDSSFISVNGRINIIDVSVFIRGDSDGDNQVEMADAIYSLEFLFLAGSAPRCLDAADANDDGDLDVTDPIVTLMHLFRGTGDLPPPSGTPGKDPTPDSLNCGKSSR